MFFIKYLRTLGFDVTNDIFAENAWYFRNSLVRANYNDLKNGIHETTEYLELFLQNLLLNEDHPLHNRTLHISGTFKEMEKPDIGAAKPDIEKFKADIEELFQPKTTSHILKLREAFPGQSIFGRSDVMSVIEIKPSRASDLLKKPMLFCSLIMRKILLAIQRTVQKRQTRLLPELLRFCPRELSASHRMSIFPFTESCSQASILTQDVSGTTT